MVMRRVLVSLADNRDPGSLAARLRRRRGALFRRLLESVPRPVRLLDLGGTQRYWEVVEPGGLPGVDIVLLNREAPAVTRPGFLGVAGDARDLSDIEGGAFDVVFSNSVIEHVGDLDDQRAMAREIQRVGRRWFVQTPNRYFPLEPHFLFPGFQFLSVEARAQLLMRLRLGWYPRVPDPARAREVAASIRLLTEAELREMFPTSTIHRERFAGLTKSLIATDGW